MHKRFEKTEYISFLLHCKALWVRHIQNRQRLTLQEILPSTGRQNDNLPLTCREQEHRLSWDFYDLWWQHLVVPPGKSPEHHWDSEPKNICIRPSHRLSESHRTGCLLWQKPIKPASSANKTEKYTDTVCFLSIFFFFCPFFFFLFFWNLVILKQAKE